MMPARSSRESRGHGDKRWKRLLAIKCAIIGTLILLLCCGLTALLLRLLLIFFPVG